MLSKSAGYGFQEIQKNASELTVLTNCEVQSMRMKMVYDRTLAEVANAFLALKKVQKVRERTMNDCQNTSADFFGLFENETICHRQSYLR